LAPLPTANLFSIKTEFSNALEPYNFERIKMVMKIIIVIAISWDNQKEIFKQLFGLVEDQTPNIYITVTPKT
jgi:hypothetical protein